jgi:hypothetical protein
VGGPTGKWYRHAKEMHKGQIDAGGISKDVNFAEVNEEVNRAINEAYQAKYQSYGNSIVGSTLTEKAQATTLQLVPSI